MRECYFDGIERKSVDFIEGRQAPCYLSAEGSHSEIFVWEYFTATYSIYCIGTKHPPKAKDLPLPLARFVLRISAILSNMLP